MQISKFMMGAMIAMTLVACSGKESMIKNYEKACNDGNAIKAAKIAAKMDEKFKETDFTEEELDRISKATIILEEKAVDNMSDMLKGASDMMNMFD